MAFPATCIRFGRFEVQPIQNVELSHEQLRIVFRTSEQSSQDDSVSFEINPMEFVKTVYTFSETSTKILFRVCEKHLDCIKADVKGLFEAFNQSAGGIQTRLSYGSFAQLCIIPFVLFCLWSQEKCQKFIVGLSSKRMRSVHRIKTNLRKLYRIWLAAIKLRPMRSTRWLLALRRRQKSQPRRNKTNRLQLQQQMEVAELHQQQQHRNQPVSLNTHWMRKVHFRWRFKAMNTWRLANFWTMPSLNSIRSICASKCWRPNNVRAHTFSVYFSTAC